MLQDLSFGRLENEFRTISPAATDTALCFQGDRILLQRAPDNTLCLPTCEQVSQWRHLHNWCSWEQDSFRYAFRMQDQNFFLWMGEAGTGDTPFSYESVRQLRQLVSKEICFAIMTGWHLFSWYRANRFCGRCGTPTVHDHLERMVRCPSCGNLIFPKICPAVIVAVTDGDRLLLSKYAGRSYTRYALIAGYTEIGETIEQTVHREVMEEVGLKVKNLRYYKSQPWGVDGNVLMGFYCDLDGSDTIHLDRTELALAEWHHRSSLPAEDDGISLTREMIRIFSENREPK